MDGGSPGTSRGKVAIVTGAGQGIGKAVALRLASDGASVVVADQNIETARRTAEEIEALGGSSLPVQVDVREVGQIQAMVDATLERYARIDIVVPSAGIVQVKRMMDISEADWDRIFSVNTRGVFFTVQLAARPMIEQGSGSIVTIASIAAQGPRPVFPHYGASKAAVISITRSAAAALAPHGIRVNVICPGVVETPMWDQIDQEMASQYGVKLGEFRRERLAQIPLGRLQKAEDVADAVAFLVSPQASNITGQTLNVDGGFNMH